MSENCLGLFRFCLPVPPGYHYSQAPIARVTSPVCLCWVKSISSQAGEGEWQPKGASLIFRHKLRSQEGSPVLPGTQVLSGGYAIVKAGKVTAQRELRVLVQKEEAKWMGVSLFQGNSFIVTSSLF